MRNDFVAFELAIVEMIEHAKRLGAFEFEMPVVDQSNLWMVTIKRMGVLDKKLSE
jgi:hypothetical protein